MGLHGVQVGDCTTLPQCSDTQPPPLAPTLSPLLRSIEPHLLGAFDGLFKTSFSLYSPELQVDSA